MTELAWPFVALVVIACFTWLANRHLAEVRHSGWAKRVAGVEESQKALLLSVKDELVPKLVQVEDRLGRTELEIGVHQ
jgi:hypothetical protein